MIIANFHEIYNFLVKFQDNVDCDLKIFRNNYIKILKVMQPVTPHMISECLVTLKEKTEFDWPIYDEKYLNKKLSNIVIQINGRKRGLISCETNIEETELVEKIQDNKDIKKHMMGKKILKKIYIKNKIINLIVK